MKWVRGIIFILICVLPRVSLARSVYIICLDGFAADYFSDSSLKTLQELKREGTFARLTPPFPTVTFTSHTTMVTGCSPGKHGIVGNQFLDTQRGKFDYDEDPEWMECEPLWVAAERQGVKTATLGWPLAYGTWNGKEASHHPVAFKRSETDKAKLRSILQLSMLPKKDRPQLYFVRLEQVDSAGHRFGPSSDETKKRMHWQDRMLGEFLKDLKQIPELGPVTFFIVSDHGMAEVKQTLDLSQVMPKNLRGRWDQQSALLYYYVNQNSNVDQVFDALKKVSGVHWYKTSELPLSLGAPHRRMGDVVGLLDPGTIFTYRREKGPRGMHGYDPKWPEMDGIFIALGDGIRSSKKSLDRVDGIQVAATVSKLLGISSPKNNEAQPIAELFSGAN